MQTVERECGTIKQSVRELRDNRGARRAGMSQGSRSHRRGYAIARINKEGNVGVIDHDKTSKLRRKRVGNRHLRHRVRTRYETIYRQYSINEPEKGGTVEFKFQQAYKSQLVIHQTNRGILTLKLLRYLIDMDPSNFDALRVSPLFATLPKEMQDLLDSIMLTTKDVALSPTSTVGDVLEIPRQIVRPVRISS